MKVEIDQKVIQDAVVELATAGITSVGQDWELKKAMQEAAMESIKDANLPAMLNTALKDALDGASQEILESVMEETIPALKVAFKNSLKASLIAMIYGAEEGKPSYMGKDEEARWKHISESLNDNN